ncbi:GDSL esterase/lipase EXL3-like [Argentina anserina]|uniref:GDSL esterase/lipase EXL3-like n=1 Tax=Argentina anserina TaxID=57926 RepID=UPI0021763601|nr:GDSL esterase/lipase EXL3-like [Potentilla anserina]
MNFLTQKLPALFPVIVVTSIICHSAAALTLPRNVTIPALIVWGDSIVDPGNNNVVNTIAKCNFDPYGMDFNGGVPTGRFSDGRVPSDLIAEELGIKKLLPAYLDPNLQTEDLLTGVSFASGGSGYDPLTPKIVNVLSLSDQIELFREYKRKIDAAVGVERREIIVSKGIHLVVIGSNDIANTYLSTPFRNPHYDILAYTNLMTSSASKFFQALYGEGARRIGVVGVPAIGCVPSQRTLSGDIKRGCSAKANNAASLFNSKLSSLLGSLNKKLPEAKFVYFDIYNPLVSIVQNPSKFGFEVVDKGCCGTGNMEVSILCTRFSLGTCSDPSKYIFWDSFHPTEKAYKTLVPMAFDKEVNKLF